MAVLAGVVIAATVVLCSSPALAPWTQRTSVSGPPLTAAKVGSSFVFRTGYGTATDSTYALGGLLFPVQGYPDLVNDSTIPATLSMTVTMAHWWRGRR